jgi:NAD(P)-dependent dehydrogenase (short-subunit alcohol dehydrogenase family)
VLVTGGSGGLGLNAACQLAKKGANVIIVARDVQNLGKALAQISVYPFLPIPFWSPPFVVRRVNNAAPSKQPARLTLSVSIIYGPT